MAFWMFTAAGMLAAFWLCVHLIAGGRDIAAPLLAAPDLAEDVRETQYLCWHFTSVAIASMAGFFLWAALAADPAYAVAGLVLSGGFAIVGIGLVVARRGKHLVTPQGWLFVPVAALGLAGLLG